VAACPACGKENPDGFRFCGFCTAPLTGDSREQRKTVTVLFCDVTGSTALGESTDPEALRALLARYFERMKGIVESHGGTVEKFIGDAVMAVFGVPVAHEDDALRACRAAVEMRDALPELGVQARIGVNTGEVVTGTEERLATGDAVNVAARLEQAAQPGEILVGEETLRLTRDAVEVEALEPLEVKGKAQPVAAYRLCSVSGEEGFSRHLEAAMVGRKRELDRLCDAYEQAVGDRSCQLFTILGVAGVGKSRLAAEFLGSGLLGNALVVRGRCLPYGEGITYWPVVEVLKQLPEIPVGDAAATTLRGLLGDGPVVASSEEIAWAFRKQLEAAASEQPLVCVFDDLHWGEETFLDLVEHVADLSRDAPILLLCMARPELFDRREAWAGGKVNATNVLLQPLALEEAQQLIESLAQLDAGLRERILQTAEGNPLFVEEMVAFARESGDGEVIVPSTIQALLAARLDQLEAAERSVLECGAIEGRVFHRGAVQALAPKEPQVQDRLTSLVRKELVRPDTPQLPGEDAFRFRHLLIRDAAYDALPKSARAELHERFAGWLEEHGTSLAELDEILGYHLERAHGYRLELGTADESSRELAHRAGVHLAASGMRAHARGDMRGAANLLSRAASLLPERDPSRLALLVELSEALRRVGNFELAATVLAEAVEAAKATADGGLEARALVQLLWVQILVDPEGRTDEARVEAKRLIPVLEQAGDDVALSRVWGLVAMTCNMDGRFTEMEEAASRGAQHARRARDPSAEDENMFWLLLALAFGPCPVQEAIRRVNELRPTTATRPSTEAGFLLTLGALHGMAGDLAEGRRLIEHSRAMSKELGEEVHSAGMCIPAGRNELWADDPAAAERVLREGCETLQRLGERSYLSTVAVYLAESLYQQKCYDEALHWTHVSAEAAASDDLTSQYGWRAVRAKLLARQGRSDDARRLARQAIELTERSDSPEWQADARIDSAEVEQLAGNPTQAATNLRKALDLYQRKGVTVLADRAQARLTELEQDASTGSN
jgi:class 3 adenylate cyclase/tetratricopeptide (TPR) repeat protein